MKNLLKRSMLKHLMFALILTCVTASTVWAAGSNEQSEAAAALNPRTCYDFFIEDMSYNEPIVTFWDCDGCRRITGSYFANSFGLPQSCDDSVSAN